MKVHWQYYAIAMYIEEDDALTYNASTQSTREPTPEGELCKILKKSGYNIIIHWNSKQFCLHNWTCIAKNTNTHTYL